MATPQAAAGSVGFFAATVGFFVGLVKLCLIATAVSTGLIVPGIIVHWWLGRRVDSKLKGMSHEAHHVQSE